MAGFEPETSSLNLKFIHVTGGSIVSNLPAGNPQRGGRTQPAPGGNHFAGPAARSPLAPMDLPHVPCRILRLPGDIGGPGAPGGDRPLQPVGPPDADVHGRLRRWEPVSLGLGSPARTTHGTTSSLRRPRAMLPPILRWTSRTWVPHRAGRCNRRHAGGERPGPTWGRVRDPSPTSSWHFSGRVWPFGDTWRGCAVTLLAEMEGPELVRHQSVPFSPTSGNPVRSHRGDYA